jgi:hypothetical protein
VEIPFSRGNMLITAVIKRSIWREMEAELILKSNVLENRKLGHFFSFYTVALIRKKCLHSF